jgi:hypothetical protein
MRKLYASMWMSYCEGIAWTTMILSQKVYPMKMKNPAADERRRKTKRKYLSTLTTLTKITITTPRYASHPVCFNP